MKDRLLVDTSVWIDWFKDSDTEQVTVLENAIHSGIDVYTCGLIRMEVLQGIDDDFTFKRVKQQLDNLINLPLQEKHYEKSAQLYRVLRKKGVTIRKSIDCLIAVFSIENQIPLLHKDKDFSLIARHSGLVEAL